MRGQICTPSPIASVSAWRRALVRRGQDVQPAEDDKSKKGNSKGRFVDL